MPEGIGGVEVRACWNVKRRLEFQPVVVALVWDELRHGAHVANPETRLVFPAVLTEVREKKRLQR